MACGGCNRQPATPNTPAAPVIIRRPSFTPPAAAPTTAPATGVKGGKPLVKLRYVPK